MVYTTFGTCPRSGAQWQLVFDMPAVETSFTRREKPVTDKKLFAVPRTFVFEHTSKSSKTSIADSLGIPCSDPVIDSVSWILSFRYFRIVSFLSEFGELYPLYRRWRDVYVQCCPFRKRTLKNFVHERETNFRRLVIMKVTVVIVKDRYGYAGNL